MRNRIIKESYGRDLVGAGRFESRKNVVAKIMKKYPTPQSLAIGLEKLASKLDGKAKAKVLQLSQAAAGTSAKDYPAFVQKIAGLSKLWKYLATTAAAATLAAGAAWFVKSFMQTGQELDLEVNGPVGPTVQRATNLKDVGLNDRLQRTAQKMFSDVGVKDPAKAAQALRSGVGNVRDTVYGWMGKQTPQQKQMQQRVKDIMNTYDLSGVSQYY
jgi:hypothetical protein